MKGINLIPDLFKCGDFFVTFDLKSGYLKSGYLKSGYLKSGYHNVDINEDCWTYFSWECRGTRKFYTFRGAPTWSVHGLLCVHQVIEATRETLEVPRSES